MMAPPEAAGSQKKACTAGGVEPPAPAVPTTMSLLKFPKSTGPTATESAGPGVACSSWRVSAPAIVPLLLGFVLASVAGYLAVLLLGLLIRASNSGLAHYHDYFTGRWRARFRDHRVWILGIGFLSFMATIGMFMVLPSQVFPTTNSDFSRVQIEMLPGTTIRQTEVVADRVAAIINRQPETLTALESIREGRAIEL